MKALVMEDYQKPFVVREMPEPTLTPDGVILKVEANGVCRSDWHAWMGKLKMMNISFPHILGHEFCGIVEEVGKAVKTFRRGDRVVVPFTLGDGTCPQCRAGYHNLCDSRRQPGFSYWGGYAQYVYVPDADINLVRLPDQIGFVEAASMGCRYITAFHGVVDQAKVRPGEWVAVYGCGGVGLSVIQIAAAMGANVIAVDIRDDKLELAKSVGALYALNSAREDNAPERIREWTGGGAHVSVDALGIKETCQAAIYSLRKRGRHLQIGLTPHGSNGIMEVPLDHVVRNEMQIVGALGMQVTRFEDMLQMVVKGLLRPGQLVTKTITLEEAADELIAMNSGYNQLGVTVVNQF